MTIANDPNLVSWLSIPADSDFPLQNIPFGVACLSHNECFIATRIGDNVINLALLHRLGYFNALNIEANVFNAPCLNPLMKQGKCGIRALRDRIATLFSSGNVELQNCVEHQREAIYNVDVVRMMLPVQIGDYTDFYSSKEHATNVGMMFRDPENALLPNWLWLPVGYHGRSSSIITSDMAVRRPKGQTKLEGENPVYGPSKRVDFELEMGFITFDGKPLGERITTDEAEEYIFGLCLFNDWSARDIQQWEYVPLGPFLAKNFASSMSPWIVTLDALQPFKVESPVQNPPVLDYLKFEGKKSYDIQLEVFLQPANGEENRICSSNFKYMYWNMAQQLAHHTVNGCNIRCGDLMGSGTISGPTPDSYGSMLELAWKGTLPIAMSDGTTRTFIQDFDTVIFRGFCRQKELRIGFGEVRTQLLPAFE
ncbi:MAG: fumarylacetoacetase [Bacteroidetes bacterium]|nr:fumarylacetoacetase [Bacteroidota bacterium]MBM3424668.1 fumarylacetoacetase [Bacteroidota bacterium]